MDKIKFMSLYKSMLKYGLQLGYFESYWCNRQSRIIAGSYKKMLFYNNKYVVRSFDVLFKVLQYIQNFRLTVLFVIPYFKHLFTKSLLKLMRKSRHFFIFNTIKGGFLTNTQFFFKNHARMSFIIRQQRILPNFVFFFNPEMFNHIVLEAMLLELPIISVVDTNTQISGIDYPIYSNNKSYQLIKFYSLLMKYFLLVDKTTLINNKYGLDHFKKYRRYKHRRVAKKFLKKNIVKS